MNTAAQKLGKEAAKIYLGPSEAVAGGLTSVAGVVGGRAGELTGKLHDVADRLPSVDLPRITDVTSRIPDLAGRLPELPDLGSLPSKVGLAPAKVTLMARLRRMIVPLTVAGVVFAVVMIVRSMRTPAKSDPYTPESAVSPSGAPSTDGLSPQSERQTS